MGALSIVVDNHFLGCWTGTNSQASTSIALPWIQCKLGKQYLLNKVTPPWESNPEPFSYPGNYGYHRSVCWVKKFTCGHLPQIPSKIGPPIEIRGFLSKRCMAFGPLGIILKRIMITFWFLTGTVTRG